MPIYEYRCRDCKAEFETLTTMAKADEIECKACGSENTERLLSVFGVSAGIPDSPCADGAACSPQECGAGGGCPFSQ